jgi:hypothetical protein
MGDLVTVRFGSDATQFEMSEKAPKVGDVLKRNGDNWEVVEIKEDSGGHTTVILKPGMKPTGS